MAYGATYGGPVASYDNGDGSFTFHFDDGRDPLTAAGPVAEQMHAQTESLEPSLDPNVVAEPMPPQEDPRLAINRQQADALGLPRSYRTDETRSDAAPDFGVPNPTVPKPAEPEQPTRTGTTEVAPAYVDPSQLSFGQGQQRPAGGAPQAVYVKGSPAHWQAAAKTEQPGFQASEELQTGRQAATGLAQDVADKEYEAQKQLTTVNIAAAKARRDAAQQAFAEDEARNQEQANQVAAKMTEIDRMGNDIAAKKVDPEQLFHEKGALGGIGFAIAAAMGQFAAGINGGPNTAVETINHMVERNIAAQNANISNAKDALAAKEKRLGMLQHTFTTKNEQIAAQRQLMWKAVDAQIDEQKANLGSAADEAAYAKMKLGVQEYANKSREQTEKEAWTQASIQSRFAPAVQGGMVSTAPTPSPFQHNLYVPQFEGNAPTEKEAEAARAAGGNLAQVRSLVEQNVALRENPKAFVPGTDAHEKLKSNQADIALTVKETKKLGVLAGPDMDLITGLAGDSSSIRPGQTAAMKNFLANSEAQNAYARQHLGILPVTVAPYMDPKTRQIKMGQTISGNIGAPRARPTLRKRGE